MRNKKEEKFGGFVKPLTEVVEKHKNREWTNEEKVQMAQRMFDSAEENLEEYLDRMVRRAKDLVTDLERNKKYYYESKAPDADNGLMSSADHFRSALRTVQNCFNNYDSSDAARHVAKYERADIALKIFKGDKTSLW